MREIRGTYEEDAGIFIRVLSNVASAVRGIELQQSDARIETENVEWLFRVTANTYLTNLYLKCPYATFIFEQVLHTEELLFSSRYFPGLR